MADLIDLTRAKYGLGQAITTANYTLDTAEETTLSALITAISKAIKAFCKRQFDSQTFDQFYSGNGENFLQLREYPILSITRMAEGPKELIAVKNTSWPTNSRATIRTTSTALVLVHTASGASTTNTLTFADSDKDTLGELVTAINALGSGWSARLLDTNYSTWASADLTALQGVFDCSNSKEALLKIHVNEVSDYTTDDLRGILYNSCNWVPGILNYRVTYTAGYATVPEDVQEACAQWVIEEFWKTKRDPAQQTKVDAAANFLGLFSASLMPQRVKGLLLPYKRL